MKRIRACAACLFDGRLLAVELRDPSSGARFWTLPGGEIEPGEAPEDTAVRETLEETGYRITPLVESTRESHYPFVWDGTRYECTTYWLLAHLTDPNEPPSSVDDASYLLRSKWIPVEEAEAYFSYHESIRNTILELIALAR